MSTAIGTALLFCPADRPERFARAVASADHAILDLEDAVSVANKDVARQHVVDALPLLPSTTIVRVNAVDSPWFADDLRAVRRSGGQLVMLPKATAPIDIDKVPDVDVVVLCETAIGIQNAQALAAHERCIALMWGGEDLIADLGGTTSRRPDGRYRDVVRLARSSVLLAAAAARVAAIDGVHLKVRDSTGLAAESRDAAASGFTAKACIHPDHVPIVREAFRPDEASIGWATDVIELAQQFNSGVFVYDGQMIDGPLLAHARRILFRTDKG